MPVPSLVSAVFVDPSLRAGETSQVNFTFSEAVTGFDLGDLTVPNGALSVLSTMDNITYVATFTPAAGVTDATNVITVDMAGVMSSSTSQLGAGAAYSGNYATDTVAPSVAISSSSSSLLAGEIATITLSFSEAVAGFSLADLSSTGGSLSNLAATANPLVYTAAFTPNGGVSGLLGSVSIAAAAYTDLAGNNGAGASSAAITINTLGPSVAITADQGALKADETSTITFTFSQPPVGFGAADIIVSGGSIAGLTTGGGATYTAIFTPDSGVNAGIGTVSVGSGSYTDGSGNPGGGASSAPITFDTLRPTATILVADAQLQAGQTSQVTITFSEAVTGLDVSDLSVANGTLSSLNTADGITWTTTLTPTGGAADATNLIVLDTALVTDLAGNSGAGVALSNNYAVGYVPPPTTPVSDDDIIALPAAGGSVSAGPGNDNVAGRGGDDFIHGNTGADTLVGGGGDDTVRGGQGEDFVHGNIGDDVLFGDLGQDTVFGGQGNDFVQGGMGNDYVLGDLGQDTVLGGQGADTVIGGDGNDHISGDLGDDVLVGGGGADLFNFIGGGGRDVVMDFSQGQDDQIRISPTDAADFTALSARFVEDGGNTIIELDSQAILLVGVSKTALAAADFVFG